MRRVWIFSFFFSSFSSPGGGGFSGWRCPALTAHWCRGKSVFERVVAFEGKRAGGVSKVAGRKSTHSRIRKYAFSHFRSSVR